MEGASNVTSAAFGPRFTATSTAAMTPAHWPANSRPAKKATTIVAAPASAGRFVVLARDGVPEANLVWKDTVLVRTGDSLSRCEQPCVLRWGPS